MAVTKASLALSRTGQGKLLLGLGGDWVVRESLQTVDAVQEEIDKHGVPAAVAFDAKDLGKWDSALVSFAMNCANLCEQKNIPFACESLPRGVQQLIALARAVPEKKEARRAQARVAWTAEVGETILRVYDGFWEATTFLGETVLAGARLVRRKAQFRWPDALGLMQECGPEALGVVALINFLVGLILAFVGAIQLLRFGASIYVADLVGIATVREMGCLMTAIIICGRTGAAFAAQLGTMKVNEEIDAFKTFGISSFDFLVLPRVLALVAMMPILCVFADLIGIAGGFVASICMLDVSSAEYIDRTVEAITLTSFLLGIGKSAVFGALVAMTGCWRGLQTGNSAAAVGLATTSAVVTGITTIIAADGVFAVICYALQI